jgi:hypothetical protein
MPQQGREWDEYPISLRHAAPLGIQALRRAAILEILSHEKREHIVIDQTESPHLSDYRYAAQNT